MNGNADIHADCATWLALIVATAKGKIVAGITAQPSLGLQIIIFARNVDDLKLFSAA